MITDDGKNDMRGVDYVAAKARKCPRCKSDIERQNDLKPQQHACGMRWKNLAHNGKLIGYMPLGETK